VCWIRRACAAPLPKAPYAVRNANGVHILAMLRRIALMMIEHDTTLEAELAIRIKMAAIDSDSLAHMLTLGIDT
jgi:hypothetical protein